jgi:ribulose-phosphate 3-epimerase
MSVNPGFGGQKFIPATFDKVQQLRSMLDDDNPKALIEVDGGVGPDNAAALFDAGANVLVAGNAVFKADDPLIAIARMKEGQ